MLRPSCHAFMRRTLAQGRISDAVAKDGFPPFEKLEQVSHIDTQRQREDAIRLCGGGNARLACTRRITICSN
jgi:hypothetical protein